MALDLGELVGFLELNATRWNKGIDDALRSVDEFGNKAKPRASAAGAKAGDAFGDALVPEAQRAGEEAGEAAGEGMLTKGKVAAGAAGLAFGMAFNGALEVDSGRDKLVAQLGLTGKDAARVGKVAGDLYAAAYGDSMDHVNTSVASVMTSIDGMEDASSKRLQGLTATALDFATAFEVDVVRATQVAGVMIDSGLAKNGKRAFDLLVKASQQVPVQLREDVLDATEEYSQFFATLGYDGQEAFALLVDASEKGMYGIDKAGDAVKEFTIRSTDMSALSVSAYELIGLSAEDMATKILKGGDDARHATQQVIDGLLAIENPAERANAAIALFGTPIEDLNVRDIPDFLRSLKGTSDAMDDVRGASKRMGDGLNDNAATKFKELKRTLEMDFVNFLVDEALPVIENDVLPALDRFGDWFTEDGKPALKEFRDALKPVVGMTTDLVELLNDLPTEAKMAGVVALLGGVGAAKLRGGSGLAGGVGSALGMTKPVPVFVTNPGGLGGGGGKGTPIIPAAVPKVLGNLPKWAPYVPIGLSSAPGQDSLMSELFGFGPKSSGGLEPIELDLTTDKARAEMETFNLLFETLPEELQTRLVVKGGPESRAEVKALVEQYDLTKEERQTLFKTFGIPQSRETVDKYVGLLDYVAEPRATDLRVTGVAAAKEQIGILLNSLADIPGLAFVDNAIPSGGGGGRGRGGGTNERSTTPDPRSRGVNFDFRGATIKAHDYNDFMRQSLARTQQRAAGGF